MKKNLGNTPVVAPLPVLIVATYDEQGTPDAMNVAWGGQCGYHHVALNLALSHKTTENLKHTKAFTLSIATVDTLVVSDYFGLVSGHKENKMQKPVCMSACMPIRRCTHHRRISFEHLNARSWKCGKRWVKWHVVGEVVNVLADESVLDEQGKVDLSRLRPISYDSVSHSYRILDNIVGKAFKDGAKIK